MAARNLMTPGVKGEIDVVGFNDPTLAVVEVKTRSADDGGVKHLLPEGALTTQKQRNVSRIARRFRRAGHLDTATCRFDVVAIKTRSGAPPVILLR